MMKIIIDYPNADEEFVVVQRVIGAPQQAQFVISHDELMHMQSLCKQVYVDPSLIRYAVSLSAASRDPSSFGLTALGPMLMHGASPRASIWMIEAARAMAALRARAYALPEDVIAVAPDVLRHRISLSDEALANQVDAEQLLKQLLAAVPAPVKPLGS
jgi:MoxR-like ATPase